MPSERGWAAGLADHEVAVAEFRAQVAQVPPERWQAPAAEGKWSPAEEALHVALAYELALANLAGGVGMRLRVSPLRARLLRWFLLPQLLRTGKFPREVPAPREIRPSSDEAHTLTAPALLARLERAAQGAAEALHAAQGRRPPVRMVHAYFGALRPLTALRLLSAHTRHHARRLARRGAPAGAG
jgi:hypothetical protein